MIEPAAPQDDFDRDVWSVLGVPVDMATVESAAERVRAAVDTGTRLSFVTPNVNWFVRARKDPDARRQVIDADFSLADGMPLVQLARGLGAPLTERVAGADLFERLRMVVPANRRAIRVFFLGGRDGAADLAVERLNAERSGFVACGALNPGHGDIASMSTPELIDTINRARPDFLLVALGAAKGQGWIDRNQSRLGVPVIAHLGAVVDFVAGTKPRAPEWMSASGLEWIWRIGAEPALWRRYVEDGLALIQSGLGAYRAQRRALAALKPNGELQIAPTRPGASGLGLSGDALAGGLAPVRSAFRRAAASAQDVVLDVQGLGRVDAAFLGLLLMLEKAVRAHGHALGFANVPPRLAGILERDGHTGVGFAQAPVNARHTQTVSRSLTQ